MVCLLLFFGCKALFDRLWNSKSGRNQIVASSFFIMSYRFITLTNLSFFIFFFFYLGFLSQTFTIHGTAGEGGGYLFNSSLPLPPASRALRH